MCWQTNERRVLEHLGEHVDDAAAIRANRASAQTKQVRTASARTRRRDLLRAPRAAAVGRVREGQRHRERPAAADVLTVTAELGIANVDTAEESARGGVVRPDLLLV